jgi:hypothetical protein
MMMKLKAWVFLLTAAFAASSVGSIVPVPCDDPPPFTAWENAKVAALGAKLNVGQSYLIELKSKHQLNHNLKAEQLIVDVPDGYYGDASLLVKKAGRLSIALSGKSRVDLVRHGRELTSIAHRHGEGCTSIHKIVTFAVNPGTYRVKFTAAPGDHEMFMAVYE